MERSLTFRFYTIKRKNGVPALIPTLQEISKIKKKGDREKELRPDHVIRLEEFETDGPNCVVGEVVRVQSTNMPSEVDANGRKPLSTKNPLGHGVIFRFNESKSVLCVQHEPRIASAGRILDYITECWPAAIYEIAPMLKKKAWERFDSGDVRKLSIRVANPEQLELAAKAHQAAADSFRAMGEAYSAPSIKIELSMGGRRAGKLKQSVKGLAKALIDKVNGDGASVESMSAVAYVDDSREEIDLIEERLKVKDTLPLDDRDPVANYKIKKQFIRKIMHEQGY